MMNAEQLAKILAGHARWLAQATDGDRAVLDGADLSGANMKGADLRSARLNSANLHSANLAGANLRMAELIGADLAYADLTGASLTAHMRGANLTNADLTGAVLVGANLSRAKLTGAKGLPDAPIIPNLDARILQTVTEYDGKLDMSDWHSFDGCCTTHCRAGWAIHLAGHAGYELERELGSNVAGALIYNASTGRVPDFFASDEDAMADIRKEAGK